MSKNLKIELLSNFKEFNHSKSVLILHEAGDFSVAVAKKDHGKTSSTASEFKHVKWCWQIFDSKGKLQNNERITALFQQNINTGLNFLKIKFSKFLEGGGLIWLEPFTDHDPPTGNPTDGIFVCAIGTSKVLAAEWKDKHDKKITGKVAFGSTVYLHLYTQGLFDQYIQILLRDTKFLNADLTLVAADTDGSPVQKLSAKPNTKFSRKIEVHKYDSSKNPDSAPPSVALSGYLTSTTKPSKDTVLMEATVQKCVVEVFVQPTWQHDGSGSNLDSQGMISFDTGRELYINPIVYHSRIKDGKDDVDTVLHVSKNEGKIHKGEAQGNNPAVVGKVDKAVSDDKNTKDFTIGVFIDGTMNNRYDTIARTNWEKKRLGESKDVFDNAAHLKIYAKSKKDVAKGENYMYGETSYENDLSNPAILFDNYDDKLKNTFKVYTEGMGTNTLADENLNVIKYKADDMMGAAVAWGSSGIVERVSRAIVQTAGKIKLRGTEKIGTLTIDVFGFSRGAASARHFVHEITFQSYFPKNLFVDHMNRKLESQFVDKLLPQGGYLSRLLLLKGVEYNSLVIRFAGLYDSVAHYGVIQGNDIRELGLNSISKAKHVVHMTAGDEHRKNFSLARIPRKQNHIELNMPGVHCDVGGSYAEGRPEGKPRGIVTQDTEKPHVLASDTTTNIHATSDTLEQFRTQLINEGWFQKHQIEVKSRLSSSSTDMDKYNHELETHRAYVSNQYSYIPLQMMLKFAKDKGLIFGNFSLERYEFSNNIFPKNIEFLNRIKSNLEDYANKVIAQPMAEHRYHIETDDLKTLRNNYLHYNATDTLVNEPEPNRIRDIVKP